MRKVTLSMLAIPLLVSITAAQPTVPEDVPIDIQVSPSTILLCWTPTGNVRVTVHTDVRYSLFINDPTTTVVVELGGVAASSIFPDTRGNLVAKFDYQEIAKKVEEGPAILTLIATDTNGVTYSGSDDVRVREMDR